MFHKKLVVLAFDSRMRAGQAHLALLHLAEQGRLVVHDAVLVTRNETIEGAGAAFVEDLVDDGVPLKGTLGTAFWSAFFGAALDLNAAAGLNHDALAAVLHEAGLAPASLHELKAAVGADGTAVALLVSDVDPLAVVVELERFHDARVVITNLPGKSVDTFQRAVTPAQMEA